MILLDELLNAGDFGAAVNGLALLFREKYALPAVYQLGLVVPDVEEAAGRLERQGLGPFFIAAGSPVFWRERGEERRIRGKIGLTCHQGFELELVEPLEGSHVYSQSLDTAGRVVVHHLGLLVPDVDAWADRLVRAGQSVWVRGRLARGPVRADFAFMDTAEEAGITIELICWQVFNWRVKPVAGVLNAAGRLQKWFGKKHVSG